MAIKPYFNEHSMRALILALCIYLPLNSIAHAEIPELTNAIDWKVGKYHDYEADNPGWGYSQGYESTAGWITIYSYTGGIENWAEGISDNRLLQFLTGAIDEIEAQHANGKYASLQILKRGEHTIDKTQYHQIRLSFMTNGNDIYSSIFLTVKNGKMLKYRISLYGKPGNSDDIIDQFIAKTQDIPLTPPKKSGN